MFDSRSKKSDVIAFRVTPDRAKMLERYRSAKSLELGRHLTISEGLLLALDDRAGSIERTATLIELQQDPTISLWRIRQKAQLGDKLTPAEWLFFLDYVRIGIEDAKLLPPMSNILLPTPESARCVVAATRSLLTLKCDLPPEIQSEIYRLLGGPIDYNEPLSDSEKNAAIPALLDNALEPFQAPDSCTNFPQIGAALLQLARALTQSPEDLHAQLAPHFADLWKIAARGHFTRHRKPIRTHKIITPEFDVAPNYPRPLRADGVEIKVNLWQQELAIEVKLGEPATVALSFVEYPQVNALRRAIADFDGTNQWISPYFHVVSSTQHDLIHLWSHKGLVRVSFTHKQWQALKGLMDQTWSNVLVAQWAQELERQYGEQG